MKKRASGILLHITSLPSPYGIGDLGPQAYRFVDCLVRAKQSCWQILPLNPTTLENGNSPYSTLSAFAGNTMLISPDLLLREGFLLKEDLRGRPRFPEKHTDYAAVVHYKKKLLNRAYRRFKESKKDIEYEHFCLSQKRWLDDFALFVALRDRFKRKLWSHWPKPLRDREPSAIQAMQSELHDAIEREKFLQFVFMKQWNALKTYANERGVRIIGDMAIYVAYDSADVWAHPDIFKLKPSKQPKVVSGFPPDYFSQTGQLWGTPIYDWDRLKETGYDWWIRRVRHNLMLYDILRIDHFRGFITYWEVPAHHKTAQKGRWRKGPGDDFFHVLFRHFPFPPIIVEVLGYVTPEIREYIDKYELANLILLLFAFESDAANPYLPHNHVKNAVIYTGTHDNNTVRGWYDHDADAIHKRRFLDYLGFKVADKNMHWEFIRLAMMSVANLVIIPLQDVLGLNRSARMNFPSRSTGQWEWRVGHDLVKPWIVKKLAHLTEIYGRD